MGEIVERECEQDDDDEYYALKLFSLRDPNQRTMLVRELTLLCTFQCDCLVQMEGAFLDLVNRSNDIDGGTAASNSEGSSSFSSASGNTVTLVLEYMDRGSLADLIIAAKVEEDSGASSTMIPEYAIAAIAYQILWGLSYLHFEGVLHRDIKPANVLVSSSGRVKLADFGIVSKQKQLLRRSGDDNDDDDGEDVNEGTIMNRTVIGTTRYMSPERLRGETYKRSSDVWSVGLVLLEIVRGGISPFEEVTSVVELVQTLDECRMNDYIPESTSNGLREILVGSLDHCPHKRIPASILLSSPWFQFHNIHGVQDASSLMMVYLDTTK
jgi:serine/threonine protein kinase